MTIELGDLTAWAETERLDGLLWSALTTGRIRTPSADGRQAPAWRPRPVPRTSRACAVRCRPRPPESPPSPPSPRPGSSPSCSKASRTPTSTTTAPSTGRSSMPTCSSAATSSPTPSRSSSPPDSPGPLPRCASDGNGASHAPSNCDHPTVSSSTCTPRSRPATSARSSTTTHCATTHAPTSVRAPFTSPASTTVASGPPAVC